MHDGMAIHNATKVQISIWPIETAEDRIHQSSLSLTTYLSYRPDYALVLFFICTQFGPGHFFCNRAIVFCNKACMSAYLHLAERHGADVLFRHVHAAHPALQHIRGHVLLLHESTSCQHPVSTCITEGTTICLSLLQKPSNSSSTQFKCLSLRLQLAVRGEHMRRARKRWAASVQGKGAVCSDQISAVAFNELGGPHTRGVRIEIG